MYTSSSLVYVRSVVQVAMQPDAIRCVHEDIIASPSFEEDVVFVRSMLSKDTVTVTYQIGQDGSCSSPTPRTSGVLYK